MMTHQRLKPVRGTYTTGEMEQIMERAAPLIKLPTEYDMIGGSTSKDHFHHLLARTHFISRLCHRQRTLDLWSQWSLMTKLIFPAWRLREQAKYTASLRVQGVSNSQLVAAELKTADLRVRLRKAMWECDCYPVWVSAWQYVNGEMKLPWPWVALDLMETWSIFLWGRATTQTQTWELYLLPQEIPAPNVELKRLPNEGMDMLIARLEQLVKELRKEKAKRDGGKPSSPENIERYVEWFFRRRVEGEKWEQIGMRDAEGALLPLESRTSKGNVKRGVDTVEGWFDLGGLAE